MRELVSKLSRENTNWQMVWRKLAHHVDRINMELYHTHTHTHRAKDQQWSAFLVGIVLGLGTESKGERNPT